MSSRKYAESLSKEELIELAVVCLDELELVETVRYRDVEYDDDDNETKLEIEIPYWEANGEDLISSKNPIENAVIEVHKIFDGFKEEVYLLSKDLAITKSETDELFKKFMCSDQVIIDALHLSLVRGLSIEEHILTQKVELNGLIIQYKKLLSK